MSEQNNNSAAPLQGSSQLVSTERAVHPALSGMMNLSAVRQFGLMLGLAISVAIGVAVVLWSQEPNYDLLFSNMAEQDSAEIVDALDKLGVEYEVDTGSGAIMVPAGDVRELKLKLAAQGLPRSTGAGYELLDKETGFGTSKNVEQMRFQRALEGEIARTISTIQNVKAARVLLALPKQSVFLRKQKKPSASVIVNLYQGRMLEKEQIEAIVHLVASSVPMLEASQVTVVDQKGRLLSTNDSSSNLSLSSKQFEYKKNIEEHLMERIQNILTPLVGSDGFRTQISADVDFTVTERTQEMFNPDLPALRSEQTLEEQNSLSAVQGVPGALSNQPPPAGVAPEVTAGAQTNTSGTGSVSAPTAASKSATRNFELDKTITHTRLATGELRRLSVAVVVDNKKILQPDNASASQPYSQEDINQMTALVKQAVGFDSARGDQVTVTNVAFRAVEDLEPLPELMIWEQSWFRDALKQLVAVAVVLFLIFGVLRPTLRGLVSRQEEETLAAELAKVREEAEAIGGVVKFNDDGKPVAVPVGPGGTPKLEALSGSAEDLLLLDAPQSYEKRLEYVRKLIDEDPKLVAQVMKEWLKDDG